MWNYVTCRNVPVPDGIASLDIDSGAFQQWRRGIQPNIERVAAYYDQFPNARLKMMLDVIGGTEQQQRNNLAIMESMGQRVTPVFHGPHCESWEWFDELCERYPVVAIGSVVPDNTSSAATDWLSQVFDRICDRDGVPRYKIHGLRMASRVRDFPFDSVDGSTWIQASKNGRGPDIRGSQVDRPWQTCEQLQAEWVRYYDYVPKCERWIPRRFRSLYVLPTPKPDAVGQLAMFGEC